MNSLLKIRFEMQPARDELFNIISDSCSKIITLCYNKDFFYKVDILIKELLRNAIKYNKDDNSNIIVNIDLFINKIVVSISNIADKQDYEQLKDYLEKLKDDKYAHSNFLKIIKEQKANNTTGGLGLNRLFKEKDCSKMITIFENNYLTVIAELETL